MSNTIAKYDFTGFSEVQKKVWKYLSKRNKVAASAYIGALITFADTSNPDRIAQAAHSLRELINLLMRNDELAKDASIRKTVNEVNKSELQLANEQVLAEVSVGEDNVNKIASRLSEEGVDERVARAVARIWNKTHKWFTAVAHHAPATQNLFLKNLYLLEKSLLTYLGLFYDAIHEIDKIIKNIERPSKRNWDELEPLLQKEQHRAYLLETLNENKVWLKYIAGSKLFNFTEPPKMTGKDSEKVFWQELNYLKHMALRAPSEILKILLKIEKTDNPVTHIQILEALVNLPNSYAKKYLQKVKIENWFAGMGFLNVDLTSEKLITKLVKEGDDKTAASLCQKVLRLKKHQEEGKKITIIPKYIDIWSYQKILNIFVGLSKRPSLETSSILTKNLAWALNVVGDTDYIWNTSIKDNEEITDQDDVICLLFIAIRRCIKSLDKSKVQLFNSVLKGNENESVVLLRLRMYLCRTFPESLSKEAANILLNEKNLFNLYLTYDCQLTASRCFQSFSESAQGAYLGLIKAGPQKTLDKEQLDSWTAQMVSPVYNLLSISQKTSFRYLEKELRPIRPPIGHVTTGALKPKEPISQIK